jgi:hypothetical protein
MRTLFAVGIVLATITVASAAYSAEAIGTLRSQRYAAYTECVNKSEQTSNRLSPSGTAASVARNYDHPLVVWATTSLRAQPDLGCYAFLTTKERAAQSALEKEGHPADGASH